MVTTLRPKRKSKLAAALRGLQARASAVSLTIRGWIVIAFVAMSVVTIALGTFATFGTRNAGVLT